MTSTSYKGLILTVRDASDARGAPGMHEMLEEGDARGASRDAGLTWIDF